jgi:hypothetical protein
MAAQITGKISVAKDMFTKTPPLVLACSIRLSHPFFLSVLPMAGNESLPPSCRVMVHIGGPWNDVLNYEDTTPRKLPEHALLDRVVKELNLVTTTLWGPWNVLLPQLHRVASLFKGRVVTRGHTSRTCTVTNMKQIRHMAASMNLTIKDGEHGPPYIARALERHLAFWEETGTMGKTKEDLCLCVVEDCTRLDSQVQVWPFRDMQVVRLTLGCLPGWSLLGWRITHPTFSMTIEQATLRVQSIGNKP